MFLLQFRKLYVEKKLSLSKLNFFQVMISDIFPCHSFGDYVDNTILGILHKSVDILKVNILKVLLLQ